MTKTDFQKTVYDQPLQINKNFAAATTATDTREFWQKVIDALQKTMLKRATIEQSMMTVPGLTGKTIQYMTMKELQDAEAYAQNQLMVAVNGGRRKKVITSFI